MNRRDYIGWILLFGALSLGALAYVVMRGYLADEAARLKAEAALAHGEMRAVVVASRNLMPGEVIDDTSMAIGEIPARHLSHRSVSPKAYKALRGRVLSRPMVGGEPLLRDFIAGALVERFSDLLAPGDRALTLEVSALENHAGMLVPGDYVDLFVDRDGAAQLHETALQPVLERVRVIAAGPQPLRASDQRFQPLPADARRYTLISIAVSAADAERILHAQSVGRLHYLLRNAGDRALPAGEAGRPHFGEPRHHPGYLYFSNAVPGGQRHLRTFEPRPPSRHMATQPNPDAVAAPQRP
ncbi:Flp pilus assembly protein CpaB [Flagellatimonas centrodinii]|uniref:Flp pilus assembly protein CpaB n=1 Tax=Flagellatimonas centrodinii TaxID=2806210 RepID=UPI001FEED4F5|nr:Flp pilus assembly protein CpaB [Flagellatimonas centrodinii]ULQ47136.1 Flp pilus assembly protein CpaB [Flagellatimonas centrodinii]